VVVVPPPSPPNISASGYVVVRLFRGPNNEIGRGGDSKLVSLNSSSYTFDLNVTKPSELTLSGPFILRAYILDKDRYIYYSSEVSPEVSYPTAPKSGINVRVALVQNPGFNQLSGGSAGTLLLLVGILSALLAGGMAIWRRRRSHVLKRRFA
jgi:LPXTG-motif cell wall-anchored protein